MTRKRAYSQIKQGRYVTKPLAVDLFSGAGGLTLGLKRAGFSVLSAIELDPLAGATFQTNHPECDLWLGDIRKIAISDFRRHLGLRPGQLHLLVGCPPCQGFSTINTRNGSRRIDDPRNNLGRNFLRFVEEFEPIAIMLENVPMLSEYQGFSAFCKRLVELGYSYEYRVLDASNYGVPQRRRRLILLAGRYGFINFAPAARKTLTVRDAISHLAPPGRGNDPLHDYHDQRTPRIDSLIKQVPLDGGGRNAFRDRKQLACHKRCDGFYDVYGRMAWDSPAPTITGGCVNPSKGRFLHPQQHRAITLREAALLQAFPQRYKFSMLRGKYRAAEIIGNALPPEFVRRHAVRLHRYLDENV